MSPWAFAGLLLLLLGLLLTAAGGVANRSQVVGEGTMRVADDRLVMGPYRLSGGSVQVWVGDRYPGDDWEHYDAHASPDGLEDWRGNHPMTSRTHRFDGEECELVASFGTLPEGDWTITLESYGDPPDRDERVGVYVVESGGPVAATATGAGLSMLFVGAILTPLAPWPRAGGRGGDGDDRRDRVRR